MLTIYNSLTKKVEVYKSLENKKVKMYTCGPSIYQLPHIGNYRTFLFEDILQRYLEYSGFNVYRIMNITDLEDKAIAEAEKEHITLYELSEENTRIFLEELKNLKVKTPDGIPRSLTSVDQAVRLIEVLLKKGYAYRYKENIYYDPSKFKNFGKLYGLDMHKWPKKRKRFHKDTYLGNRWNMGDFILWHGFKEGDIIYWDTSIGKGRPAWNIQDPAMATEHLGFKADICCGGIDNIFRHHDYIIAVIEGITNDTFAHYWLHSAHLYVDGKKMSKSKGNIIYPIELIKQGFQWDQIRFFLTYGHYRRILNFTFEKFIQVCERLDKLRNMLKNIQYNQTILQKSDLRIKKLIAKLIVDFEKNMNNDLHIKEAFDSLFKNVSKLVMYKLSVEEMNEIIVKLKAIDKVLQVIF